MQRNIITTSLCSDGQSVPNSEVEHTTCQSSWLLRPFKITSSAGSPSCYDSTSDDAQVDDFHTVAHSWKRTFSFSHLPSKSPSSLYGAYPWDEECIRSLRKTPQVSLNHQSDEEGGTEADEGNRENQENRTKIRSETACSQVVKRKLQSASLALSIGIFRTRRRVRKALG